MKNRTQRQGPRAARPPPVAERPLRARLPPLNALRAFEAAARHTNFTRAAQELNVTQSAISYQVKYLEERLGMKLFARTPSGLLLTPEAEEYFAVIGRAFDSISQATERFRSASAATRLTVSTFPQFARYWLLPRLPDFTARYPDVQIDIVTALRTLDFDRNSVDVAVRWGSGWSDYDCQLLFSATLTPVVAPRILEEGLVLREPADLMQLAILDVEGGEDDWPLWFEAAGIPNANPPRRLRFDSVLYALQAASDGLGAAMARLPLTEVELETRRLVAPFDIRCASRKAWYLLVPRLSQSFHKVRVFRDWIVEHAEATRLRR
jgi:LysR family transcriptional regulator, glycine cleavage system transcriptional activator